MNESLINFNLSNLLMIYFLKKMFSRQSNKSILKKPLWEDWFYGTLRNSELVGLHL